ncbi:MAG: hypothetical protein ACRELE_11160, partial [Gemmatimonadales bacterium]
MNATRSRMHPAIWVVAVAMLLAGCHRQQNQVTATRAPLPAAADSMALAARGSGGPGGDLTHGERVITVVAGGRAADSAALAPLNLTLGAIGYRNGIVLFGTSAEATIAIPVDDGLRPGELKLRLIPTPRMPAATLVLRQRDRVLALRDLTDTTTTVTLSLMNVVVENGKATLQISLSVPGRELCLAALFYRTVLMPESQVSFVGTPL